MKISEEEGRLKKDEEETKEMWKRKREHEEQWEGTREQRVCLFSPLFHALQAIVFSVGAIASVCFLCLTCSFALHSSFDLVTLID